MRVPERARTHTRAHTHRGVIEDKINVAALCPRLDAAVKREESVREAAVRVQLHIERQPSLCFPVLQEIQKVRSVKPNAVRGVPAEPVVHILRERACGAGGGREGGCHRRARVRDSRKG